MTDDMITTAGTVAEACKVSEGQNGAAEYLHFRNACRAGWPGDGATEQGRFHATGCLLTRCALGNRADAIKDRLVVLSVADLLGEAIHRIHHNESVSALFRKDKDATRRELSKNESSVVSGPVVSCNTICDCRHS